MSFKYRTRKVVKPEDLNCHSTLFGGRLMSWIDEECGIYCACQMKTKTLITKYISEMNFMSPARMGDVIEIGVDTAEITRTSITVKCHVRIMDDHRDVIKIDRIVFVAVDENGRPTRHALSHMAGKLPADAAVPPKRKISRDKILSLFGMHG